MVDGSNESLEHADQEYDPILRKGITLQKSFKKVDVPIFSGEIALILKKRSPLSLDMISFLPIKNAASLFPITVMNYQVNQQ